MTFISLEDSGYLIYMLSSQLLASHSHSFPAQSSAVESLSYQMSYPVSISLLEGLFSRATASRNSLYMG